MKVPTDVMVSFDRMSTREELQQVLDLLTDGGSATNDARFVLPEAAAFCGIDELEGAWAEINESDENAPAAEIGNLASMFLDRHERTN